MNDPYTAKKVRLVMDLRTKGIKDLRVLGAIEKIPRDMFVPDAVKDQAWEDMALPIGRGQTISQPFVVAVMTEALALTDRDKVLEIGTGCGYQSAILAKLCRRVYTIERHKPLLVDAEKRHKELRLTTITAIAGDGMLGWPKIHGIEQAPFDKIICTAAARERPPEKLIDQLKPGGLLVIPVGLSGEQVLRLYKKDSEESYSFRDIMPVRFVPLLPDIASEHEAA
ncbi:MAG: protein-L-isoaspartate(D-aspartate) O-methyltransferase [Alphaproteobacteria bacterium]|nr:protein-L-isoaspartate(D-aspartate) O-methyltransferase [Alphaproteobacteria bacterium]MCD8571346.1 protein-L-isoaspartate(D-aspartate) O-methyltransferase [Alphaproteobacteria bacterium]